MHFFQSQTVFTVFCLACGCVQGVFLCPGFAQSNADPVVAKIEMELTSDEKILDTIDKGDLLTVLEERESSYLIQTVNGHKGAVSKVTVAKLAEAVPVYDELILKQPAEGRLYTLRASCFWAVGQSAKAIADFDKAIELGYDAAHAYVSRGMFQAAMGNYELALADYNQAIERDPQDEVPVLNRAAVHVSLGKYEAAIEDYTAAIQLRPDHPILYTQRAIAHKQIGELSKAVADYDRAIELAEKDISAWMGRGFLKFQQGNYQGAVDDFSHVLELSPESAVAANNRGYNYQLSGNEMAAMRDYQRALELAPRYHLALQNMAWLLTTARDGDVREPSEAIRLASAVCEISQFKDFSDLTLLAAAHASAGEFEKALGWQEKASEIADKGQKSIAAKLIHHYQAKREFDPRLLEKPSVASSATASTDSSTPPPVSNPNDPAENTPGSTSKTPDSP
jgi:tetratricopeptide (TPR) repeat protein